MDLLAECPKGRAGLPQLGVLYVNQFVCHGRANERLSNEQVHYYANKKAVFAQTPAVDGSHGFHGGDLIENTNKDAAVLPQICSFRRPDK